MTNKKIALYATVLFFVFACNREMTSNVDSVSNEQEKKEYYDNQQKTDAAAQDNDKLENMRLQAERENFKDAFEKGMAAHNSGDFKSAIKLFTQSIEAYGEYADAWGFRGMSRFKAGDNSGACSDWKRAIELGYAPGSNLYNQNCK